MSYGWDQDSSAGKGRKATRSGANWPLLLALVAGVAVLIGGSFVLGSRSVDPRDFARETRLEEKITALSASAAKQEYDVSACLSRELDVRADLEHAVSELEKAESRLAAVVSPPTPHCLVILRLVHSESIILRAALAASRPLP